MHPDIIVDIAIIIPHSHEVSRPIHRDGIITVAGYADGIAAFVVHQDVLALVYCALKQRIDKKVRIVKVLGFIFASLMIMVK
jgi:hypothetical protein